MGTFFGNIYSSLFENLFGLTLADYLWGVYSENEENLYIAIGLIMVGISLLVPIIYYYIINKPSFNKLWIWGVFGIANFVINLVVGWQYVYSDLLAGKMVELDPQTNQYVNLDIDLSNCLSFGLANAILSLIAFVVLSIAIKWGSTNASHTPF